MCIWVSNVTICKEPLQVSGIILKCQDSRNCLPVHITFTYICSFFSIFLFVKIF